MRLEIIRLGGALLAAFSLAFGYAASARWLGAAIAIGIGLLWLRLRRHHWAQADHLMLAGFVVMAGFGIWLGAFPFLMLISVVAALAAWDLAHFKQRLTQAGRVDDQLGLQNAHLQRLALVVGLGLLGGALALILPISLNLGWAIFLGWVIVIGLGRVVGGVRKERM